MKPQLFIDEDVAQELTGKDLALVERVVEIAQTQGVGPAVWFFEQNNERKGISVPSWLARKALYGVAPKDIDDLRALIGTLTKDGTVWNRDRVLLAQELIMTGSQKHCDHPAKDWAKLISQCYPEAIPSAILDGNWSSAWIIEGDTIKMTGQARPLASFCNEQFIEVLKAGWYAAVDLYHEQGGAAGKAGADLHQALRELPLLGIMCTHNQLAEAIELPVPEPEKVKTLIMAMELIPKFHYHVMGETYRGVFETALKKMALMNLVPPTLRDEIQEVPTTARKRPGM